MRSLAARELRVLRRHVAQLNRRLAMSGLPGKVKPGSQDMEKRTLRLVLGKTPDGEEILSPPVRWPQQGAGRLKIHAVPADNEQMMLRSPSGTVGAPSMADWATYDDDHAPPSDKDTEAVLEFASGTRLTIESDRTRLASDTVHVDAQTVTLGGEGGARVARVGDRVQVAAGSSAGLWPIVEGSQIVSAT
jgi:phage baseplate assembly protein gpV